MSYELMLYIEERLPRSLGTFDSYVEAVAARKLLISKANPKGWVIYVDQEIFVEDELYIEENTRTVFYENLIFTPSDDWRAY